MSDRTFLAATYAVADGVKTKWPFSFAGVSPDAESGTVPYLFPEDVKCIEQFTDANGEPATVQRQIVLDQPNVATILGAPVAAGRTIKIYRQTEVRFPLVNYLDRQSVSEYDLDMANRQNVFLAQEALDSASRAVLLNKEDNWDAKGAKLVNLAEGTEDTDAANMNQLRRSLRVVRQELALNEIPDVQARKHKLLSFDEQGQPLAVVPYPGSAADLQLELAKPTGATMVGHEGSFVNQELDLLWASIRDITSKLAARRISVTDAPWLAKGDFTTDDTTAVEDADLWCAINGYNLWFPDGTFRCTRSIDSYAAWEGNGAANVSTFNLADDKVFMVQGQKHKLPGTNLVFTAADKVFTLNRTDEFSSGKYAVRKVGRSQYRNAPGVTGIGIICDFDFKTPQGAVTLPNNDNSADIDYGLILHNVEKQHCRNVCIGGYWKKMGFMHFGIDPDNTHLHEVATMGNVGLGVLGDQSGTNSGFNAFGCFVSANDHHSRSTDPANERWGRCAVFIDIPSAAGAGSRNGISFIGGAITTKTNVVLELNRCGAVNFTNVVFENASQSGSGTGQGQAGGNKRFIGTANTGDIGFLNCRLNAEQITNPGALLDTAPNANITIVGGNAGKGFENWRGKSGVRFTVSATEQNIQMTNDPSTITGGVRMRRNSGGQLAIAVDTNPVLTISPDGTVAQPLSRNTQAVNSGAITPTRIVTRISGGTVNLDNINVPTTGIDRVVLMAATSNDIITLKHGTGNLRIGSDIVLAGNMFNSVVLIYNGAFWIVEGGRPTTGVAP